MIARSIFVKTAVLASALTASLAVLAPAALAQGQPVVVYAQPIEDLQTIRVPYGDLDLVLASEQKVLNRRVSGAVRKVCGFQPGPQGFADRGYFRCASDSWAEARPQIDRAIQRARDIALNGKSTIAAEPIRISAR
jgi:UrcA family protein